MFDCRKCFLKDYLLKQAKVKVYSKKIFGQIITSIT